MLWPKHWTSKVGCTESFISGVLRQLLVVSLDDPDHISIVMTRSAVCRKNWVSKLYDMGDTGFQSYLFEKAAF